MVGPHDTVLTVFPYYLKAEKVPETLHRTVTLISSRCQFTSRVDLCKIRIKSVSLLSLLKSTECMAIPVNPLMALTDQSYLAQTLAVPPSARVQKPQELKG